MADSNLKAVICAYDSLAPDYDAEMARNPVAAWMRARLWRHFARVFPPRARILDVTAGTGPDACWLAKRGASVVALDASPGMIALLCEAAARQGMSIDARVLPAESLRQLDVSGFDGAISTFAGLNTVTDLPQFAVDLSERLKPRARVILHALNAFCLWESAALWIRGRRTRTRRVEVRLGGQIVPHRYYNPFALWREAFARRFALRRVYALSVIAAPALVTRWPQLAPILFALDRAAGHIFPAAGDFFVLDLEKKD